MRDEILTRKEIKAKQASYTRKTKWEKWGGEQDWFKQASKMTNEELEKALRDVKKATERRVSSLKKQRVDSYAAYVYGEEKYFLKRAGSSRPSMLHALSVYHDFWASRTSTREGARAVNREQDIRLFGKTVSARGKETPKYRLSQEERTEFWAAYMEFYKQYKNDTSKYDSHRVQRIIGEAFKDIRGEDFLSRLEMIHEAVERDYNTEAKKSAKARSGSDVEDAAQIWYDVKREHFFGDFEE